MTRADVEVVVTMTWAEAEAISEKLSDEDTNHATHPVWQALHDAMQEVTCP